MSVDPKGLEAARNALRADDVGDPLRLSDPFLDAVLGRIITAYLAATSPAGDLVGRLEVAADGIENVSLDRRSIRRGYENVLREAAKALRYQSTGVTEWQPIGTAPKDKTPVLIAVPTKDRDSYIVGEAYFDPGNYEDGDWWWAGTSHGDYHGGPIRDINYWMPTHWMPLPAPPAALSAQERG